MGQQPEIQDIYPLSFMQEGMLFHSLLDQDSRAYFEQAVFTINGRLHRERFQKSIDAIFDRYDIFRTTFIHKNVAKPRQVVLKSRPSRIQFVDISHLDEKAQEMFADEFRKEDKDKGFDLQSDPLMRVSILKKAPDRYVCVWSHHHILMDGWCFGIVMKEFLNIYQSLGEGQLPSLEPVQPYGKYIKWLMRQDRKEAEAFWKKRLLDVQQTASLPKRSSSSKGELQQAAFTISEEQTNGLKNIASKAGATLNTVFQALWGVLLQRVSRCDDAVFGSVISGRPSDLAGVEKMVGLFINTVPVRVKSGSFSFLELVSHLQNETLKAEAYSYYPLYDIQAQSALKQKLFDHIIVFENVPAQREIEGMSQAGAFDFSVEDFTMEEVTNYGCSIKVIPGSSLYVRLNFDIGVYDPAIMEKTETYLRHMISSVIADPEIRASQISLLDENDARNMLATFNKTEAHDPPAPTLHTLFTRRAALSPQLPALRFSGGVLTYAELDQYSDRLAAQLRKKGAAKESIIGVLAERSPEMVISVLAVLKAGGAYVPLDPEYPEERLSYMLADSGAALLLAQPGLSVPDFSGETLEVSLSSLAEDTSETEAVSDMADADSLAYIIYTSGSTGTPKGVAVEHRQAVAFLSGMERQFPLTEEDIIVLKSSFSFDASIWQLFWWTLSGASVYLLPSGAEKDPAFMTESFAAECVTTAHFIPAMVNSFLDVLETGTEGNRRRLSKTLKRVFAGGEALAPLTAARFAELLPETALIHGYGPTEATVDAAFYVYDPKTDSGRTRLPIGRPVPGARLYILDGEGAVQPAGVAGELYIAGTGVARGYLSRPELTEERFLADPFYPGERMYKTGDIARWLPEGLVEWLGRSDGQVKVRGYRIEPGEIEAVIRQIDGVREAAVTARTDNGDTELFAYIEGRSTQDVRTELAKRLPAYMIPSQFIEMEEWPITPSGKLDRNALPAPDGAAGGHAYTAPRNVTEMKLAKLWEEVLKNGPVGIRDHFFERGGHSLKATALVSRIAKEFGVQVPLKDIFARPTVEELASVIQELEQSPYEAIQPAEKRDTYPVSSAQKRMYVLQQLEDGGVGYNMPAVLELTGPLDRNRLDEVFQKLIERHESLRTSFERGPDGEPVQRIHDKVSLNLTDETSAEAFVRPFRLDEAPLFRAALVKEADERHLLLTDMHHIISDGVSVNTLIREFGELYAGRTLAPMRIQYKDYAVWQQEFKQGEAYQKQEAYWLKQLDGELPVLELPADRARPAVRSFAGDKVSCTLDAETAAGLHRIARDHGSTLYMVLLAAYNTLLARLSGQEDIIVGSPIAGRPHKDLEPVLGMFVNTLAIRTEPKDDKRFADYLAEVRQTALDAYENQDYPFEELVEQLGVVRDTSRNPLFDVMFALQNMERESLFLNDLHLAQAPDIGHKASKFDATLYASEESEGTIGLDFEFNTDIYQKQTVIKWLSYFTHILKHVIDNQNIQLGDIDVLDDDETRRILNEFNQTKRDYPRNETISHLFEQQAAKTPDAQAIVCGGQTLTYHELNERANRIAAALRTNGVGPESVVALLTGRTPELAAGILGILKAGGAYLPIADDLPPERIEWILGDSKADILLQSDKLEYPVSGKRLFIEDIQMQAGISTNNPEQLGGPDSLAYMIYTSGSTGTPKGVMVEQRSVIRLVKNSNYIDFTPKDRLLFTSSLGFDVTVFEIFGPLLNGASVYLSDKETYLEPYELETYIQQNGITTLWLTSSLFNHLSEQNDQVFSGLSQLIIGGEALSPSHVNRVRNALPHLSVWNGYGPTENTTFSTCFLIESTYDHSIPIGRPVGNSTAYIVNSRGTLQPIGVKGELCTGGDGVARGYFGRPELTKEKFVPNPYAPGERMYRTGDLARWLPDGTIEYIGRMDDQVKIRGYRVELGEIEAALRQIDGVKEAAVIDRTGPSGNKELIAYMSLQADMNTEKVRSHLSHRLPNYMVPAYMMELEALPLSQNGKLDRKALPEPELSLHTTYRAPRNELEEQLTVIWQGVLGVKQAGIEDSFFELGGDSIKALQVSARLGRYGWKMTASDLFRHPTIKEVAPLIRKTERVIDQRAVEGEIPWTPVQQWFLSQHMKERDHFNQSVMLFSSEALQEQPLRTALQQLAIHHDALRITICTENGKLKQINQGVQKDELYSLDTCDISETDEWETVIEKEVAALQKRMDLEKGPLLKAGWFKTSSGDYLFLTIHHLAVDGVSWRILLEDLSAAYGQAVIGQPVQLPPKTDSYKEYALRLTEYAQSSKLMSEEEYWRSAEEEKAALLPNEKPQQQAEADSIRQTVSFSLSKEDTAVLLQQVNRAYNTDTQDILLTAAALALRDWTGDGKLRIAMEGHGREHILPELDISRTVGWFTSMYPVLIDLKTAGSELGSAVKTVKDTLGRIPDKGIGYGILKYITDPDRKTIQFGKAPEIGFNYLGQFNDTEQQDTFGLSSLASGKDITPTWQREQLVEMSAMAAKNQLHFNLSYPPSRFRKETMEQLLHTLNQYLHDIMKHCTGKQETEKTVSDFSSKTLTTEDLDSIASFVEEL